MNQLVMHKLLVNQSVYAQGLHATQLLGTFFDGIARHTPEGYAFQRRAAEAGWHEAVRERDEPFGDAGRSTFKGKSSFANQHLSPAGIDTMIRQIEARVSTGSGSGIILLDSYGGAINRVKKNATAFVHREALFSMQFLAYWDPSAAATPNLRWLAAFYAAMRPYVSSFAYQNYIDPDLHNWQHAYYGSNLDRLIAVKRRYDAQNVFRSRQSIPLRRR